MYKVFFLLLATLFFFSHASAQTMNVKQDGNAVQVTIQKGFELISSSQVYISETPFGTASKLSPVDHQKYVAGIKMLHTSLPKTFLNTGTEFVVYDLPLNKKLYVNAAVTSGGLVYWVNTNGGEAVTTADAAIYSIELNNPVISGETIKVSGVIDTVVHSRDFQNYSFGFSIEDGLGNITPIPPVSGLKADGKGVFATTIGISKLDNVKKYTIVLKIINPFGGEDTSLRQQFSKEKGFIPSLATEEGRESFDAQTYKLLAPLPGLSIIRDTGLCLEYKASIEAEGGKTDDIVCDINDFLNFIMKMAIAISAVVLVIRIVISGFNYMVTDIPFLKISSKNDIATALGGLALALGAWVLLNTINPRLVSGGVELQGVRFDVVNYPDVGDNTVDPDFKKGQRKFSQDATVSPATVKAVEKLKNGWEIDYFTVFQNNRMLIALKKGTEKDTTHIIDIAPGCSGYASSGTARTGDNKTPVGTWRIIDIRYTEGKAQFSGKGSNMGAAFWHISPMTTGERGIGMHGNKNGTLGCTNGCVRLKNSDILALQPYVKKGINVYVK
jgi:lipoprotein-anchoring transpeptidase ErfK/SrfK